MDISVLVPIYKVEKYVERCLRSLFTQTKTDGVEFILVNDGTPDNSMEVVRHVVAEYPHLTIKILEHEVNRGLPNTRQTAFDAASGDYIIHIDSDDWCEPTMLEDLYSAAISNSADIACCDIFLNTKDAEIKKNQNFTSTNGTECAKLCILLKIEQGFWNKLVRRDLYAKHDIRLDNNINMGEDIVTTSRLFMFANKVIYIDKALYHYVLYNENSMCRVWKYEYCEDLHYKAIKFIESFIEKNGLEAEFRDVMIKRKLGSKFAILTSENSRFHKDYANAFPEVNQYIPTITFTSPMIKFGMVQAAKGRLYIFDMIYGLSKIKTSVFKFLKLKK